MILFIIFQNVLQLSKNFVAKILKNGCLKQIESYVTLMFRKKKSMNISATLPDVRIGGVIIELEKIVKKSC